MRKKSISIIDFQLFQNSKRSSLHNYTFFHVFMKGGWGEEKGKSTPGEYTPSDAKF